MSSFRNIIIIASKIASAFLTFLRRGIKFIFFKLFPFIIAVEDLILQSSRIFAAALPLAFTIFVFFLQFVLYHFCNGKKHERKSLSPTDLHALPSYPLEAHIPRSDEKRAVGRRTLFALRELYVDKPCEIE